MYDGTIQKYFGVAFFLLRIPQNKESEKKLWTVLESADKGLNAP